MPWQDRGPSEGILYRIGLFTWSGVDLFFVLSGFLIGGILFDTRHEPLYFQNFYVRRIFRILPVYLLVCGAGVLLLTLRPNWAAIIGTPMPIPVYAVFLQNVWLAHNSWDVYLGVTWSLAVEEQFYLFFPFVIRFARKSWLPAVVAGLALASAGLRTGLYLHFGSDWGFAHTRWCSAGRTRSCSELWARGPFGNHAFEPGSRIDRRSCEGRPWCSERRPPSCCSRAGPCRHSRCARSATRAWRSSICRWFCSQSSHLWLVGLDRPARAVAIIGPNRLLRLSGA